MGQSLELKLKRGPDIRPHGQTESKLWHGCCHLTTRDEERGHLHAVGGRIPEVLIYIIDDDPNGSLSGTPSL